MEYRFEKVSRESLDGLELLFASVYHKNSPNFRSLKKRFQTGIFGAEYIGFLAYPPRRSYCSEPDIPIAYYGVFPQLATSGDDTILCAQSGDTMTHPHHQGRGLFTKLALQTYDLAKEHGIEFIYGFPSKNSYPGFKNKLGWEFPYNMLEFTRIVPTLPWGLLKRRFNLQFKNQAETNHLLKLLKTEDLKSLYKTKDTLDNSQFRLLRNQDYLDYKIADSANKWLIKQDNLQALIKFDGDLKIGEIVGQGDRFDAYKLMRKIDLYAFCLGAYRIRSFFSPNSHYHQTLNQLGKIHEAMPYGFINLSNRYDPSKLDLKFIDYDYF